MKKNFILILFPVMIAAMLLAGIAGADYSFKVPSSETVVMLENDGTMTVSVEYSFENIGQKLDYVDIGLPNNSFSLSDVAVTLNGNAENNIRVTRADPSQTGLKYGITLEMKGDSIPAGGKGTVYVVIPNIKKNLFEATSETKDDQEIEYAGFQFSPNYFGKKYVSGTTDYTFMIVFPGGASGDQVYYYTPEKWNGEGQPEAWISDEGRVVYRWHDEKSNIYSEFIFGGKFPKSVLTSTENIAAEPGGGGNSSSGDWWEPVLGVLICFVPIIGFIFFVGRAIVEASKSISARSASSYFPPQIKTDGEGIKRGLTAVEAAVLLETDLERVISMILYGLSKKEVIAVKSQDPFEVEIAETLPENLHEYELNFIEALRAPDLKGKKDKMRSAMHRLILSVSKKLEGFSLKETKEYYKSICEKAWAQVEAAETPEMKSKLLGDNFGWAMLQDDPEKKLEDTFGSYDLYPPTWWWRVDPGYHHRPGPPPESAGSGTPSVSSGESKGSGSSTASSGKPSAMPVLPGAMFARSITNSARGLGTSMVGNMNQFKTSVKNRTNPAPVSSGSHHSSGSGGCACACACACAGCACACAGGGR